MEDEYLSREYNDKVIDSRKYVEVVYDKQDPTQYYVRDTHIEQHHTDDELNKICMLVTLDIPRHHPLLIQCIEELGSDVASGPCAKLAIAEISGNIYRINESDNGCESVEELDYDDYIIVK